MDSIISELRQKIERVLEVIKTDLGTIRTGRATPSLVENLVVTVYQGTTKLRVLELATIGAADAQTLQITPFDPSIISEIQKGIQDANTGLNPVVDGHIIRISIPPLSQERREELIKLMKHKLENGRIMMRQARHDAMNEIKKSVEASDDEKERLEKEVQKVIDDTSAIIDTLGMQKEQELLQI